MIGNAFNEPPQLCKFLLQGGCHRKDCPYSHDLSQAASSDGSSGAFIISGVKNLPQSVAQQSAWGTAVNSNNNAAASSSASHHTRTASGYSSSSSSSSSSTGSPGSTPSKESVLSFGSNQHQQQQQQQQYQQHHIDNKLRADAPSWMPTSLAASSSSHHGGIASVQHQHHGGNAHSGNYQSQQHQQQSWGHAGMMQQQHQQFGYGHASSSNVHFANNGRISPDEAMYGGSGYAGNGHFASHVQHPHGHYAGAQQHQQQPHGFYNQPHGGYYNHHVAPQPHLPLQQHDTSSYLQYQAMRPALTLDYTPERYNSR